MGQPSLLFLHNYWYQIKMKMQLLSLKAIHTIAQRKRSGALGNEGI